MSVGAVIDLAYRRFIITLDSSSEGVEASPFPSFSTVEALRAWSHERNSKIAYMEAVDFIDAIFEFLKKEGWLRLNKKIPFLSGADGRGAPSPIGRSINKRLVNSNKIRCATRISMRISIRTLRDFNNHH
jgi:hypothetical protein